MAAQKDTVAAVVVTHNRKNLLLQCLEGLIEQNYPLKLIVLIDNASSDGTPELLKEKGFLKDDKTVLQKRQFTKQKLKNKVNLWYFRLKENLGGAGGFHEGIKLAYSQRVDWIWVMDDDVQPLPQALETMLSYKHISHCIHAQRVYPNGEIVPYGGHLSEDSGFVVNYDLSRFNHVSWLPVNYGCFEGMLFRSYLVEKADLLPKNFFLMNDDTYYGYLLSQYTNPIVIRDVLFKRLLQKPIKPETKLATYLAFRNEVGYTSRKIARYKIIWFFHVIIRVLNFLRKYALKGKFSLLWPMLLGLTHGIIEKWGYEQKYLKS